MIRTSYDAEADVFLVRFGPEEAQYDGSQEVAPGVFVEFDTAGHAIDVEILSSRIRGERTENAGRSAAAAE